MTTSSSPKTPKTFKVQIKPSSGDWRWQTMAKTDDAAHARYILKGLLDGSSGRIGRIVEAP